MSCDLRLIFFSENRESTIEVKFFHDVLIESEKKVEATVVSIKFEEIPNVWYVRLFTPIFVFTLRSTQFLLDSP